MSIIKKVSTIFLAVVMFFFSMIGKIPKVYAQEEVKTEEIGEMNITKEEVNVETIQHEQSLKNVSGKKAIIPSDFSNEELDLFARLVSAEAKGESFEGMVEVAMVVLNRLDDERFPNTLQEVIYEKSQFQPVDNGTINEQATEEAKLAVQKAISQRGTGDKSVFFYNPSLVSSSWLETREVTKVIDNHLFAK